MSRAAGRAAAPPGRRCCRRRRDGPHRQVTVRRPGRFGGVPDMTPEEHRRRGDAADALFREMVRRAAGKD